DAELPDFRRALVDARLDAALLQVQGERQSANPAADDRYLHAWLLFGREWTQSAGLCQHAAGQGGYPWTRLSTTRAWRCAGVCSATTTSMPPSPTPPISIANFRIC